ncbi:myosin-VIIa isoform X2 [Ciona intestinalis]
MLSNLNGNSSCPQNNGVANGNHETNKTLDKKPKENGSVTRELPRGVRELQKSCFAPGVKGYFEKRTRLPVLRATNLSISWKNRFPGNIARSSSRVTSQTDESMRKRCNSAATDFRDTNDTRAVRACWDVILSFMGDENENIEKGQSTRLFESTIRDRRRHFSSRKKIWRKAISESKINTNKRPQSLLIERNGHDDALLTDTELSNLAENKFAELTVLEKVRFLANVGLQHRHLRDEIYCQILKQLVHNPSLRSSALGWILLATIIGSFPPSKQIISYLKEYLEGQGTESAAYCQEKLDRILVNGERKTPPCSLELQAAKSRLKIRVPVICMDHSVRTIYVDSASTSEEMCRTMTTKNRLGDSYGFSLFLAMDSKLVPLGNRNFYIMDAISQAEYFSKINSVHEAWRIYYRREFFSPRDAGGIQVNQMRAWLTYSQICGGVQSGEYQCVKSQDLALLIAHQYCIRHGFDDIDMKRVMGVCEHSLPASLYGDDKGKKWCQMVYNTLKALAEKSRSGACLDPMEIMQQVIRYATMAFVANFTKSFRLSTFKSITDGGKPLTNLTLQLNHENLEFRPGCANSRTNNNSTDDTKQEPITKIGVETIRSAVASDVSKLGDPQFTLTLYDNTKYLIASPQTHEIVFILKQFITEIRKGEHNESEA